MRESPSPRGWFSSHRAAPPIRLRSISRRRSRWSCGTAAWHVTPRRRAAVCDWTRAALLKGGDSGAAIVAGDSRRSPLIERVTAAADADPRMPPEGSRLTSRQIASLRRWIDSAAVWPDGFVLTSPRTAAVDHWAFQPVRRATPPSITAPSRAAKRHRLVRNRAARFPDDRSGGRSRSAHSPAPARRST